MDWKKRLKHGSYAVIMTIIVIAVFFVVNLIASSQNWKIDFTKNKRFSLSDQTNQVLSRLTSDIKIDIFYIKGNEDAKINSLIESYKKKSPHIKVEYLDAAIHPDMLMQNKDIQVSMNYPVSVVFSNTSKSKAINYPEMYSYNEQGTQTFLGEQKFTNAIRFLTSSKMPTAYFTEGHKEISLDELKYFKKALEIENYTVKTINLINQTVVPDDAAFLVIASPGANFLPQEINTLDKYFANGGKGMFFLDGNYTGKQDLSGLKKLMSKWNLVVEDDMTVEGKPDHYYGVPIRIIADIQEHEIVNKLKENKLAVVMGFARSFKEISPNNSEYKIDWLLKSSNDSWGKVKFDKFEKTPEDLNGPLNLAAAITSTKNRNMRAVIFGSSYFVRDSDNFFRDNQVIQPIISFSGSLDLLMNTASWLKGETEEITIRPKATTTSIINMNEAQKFWTIGFVMLIIPAAVLGIGLTVWLRRKNR
jgi:ABC-type uncharacterized transport system involved in gliding motility auxiliary subunit